MGTTHGGMRQKNFNFYEESTRVPLVYSNPRLFKKPQRSNALVSHVDFLPTLASLVDAPADARDSWEGIDYSDQILSRSREAVTGLHRFTYDDCIRARRAGPTRSREPHRQHPRASLTSWRYYTPTGMCPPMICTTSRPTHSSAVNLAYKDHKPTNEQQRQSAGSVASSPASSELRLQRSAESSPSHA